MKKQQFLLPRLGRLCLALSFAAAASPPPAADANVNPIPFTWIVHNVPLVDSREGATQPTDCTLKVVELPLAEGIEPVGAVLLIPGLFHNSDVFDLAPEEGISYARYLMLEKHLRVYALNPRGTKPWNPAGTQASCYPKKSSLDDIAIDDIPTALRFVAAREQMPVWVFGQSQGGITLQASLAGLKRCGKKNNCFDSDVSLERQELVRGVVLFGANVSMSDRRRPSHRPRSTTLVEFFLARPLAPFFDRLKASWLTQSLSPTNPRGLLPIFAGKHSAAYWKFWEFAYHIANVTHTARTAYYNRTLDHSTMGILLQYSKGVRKDGIEAQGSGERYADALPYIRVPLVQVAFELDPLAEPVGSQKDNFERLGSDLKYFYYLRGQGHEDFLMNAGIAKLQSEALDRIVEAGQTCGQPVSFSPSPEALQ